MVIEHLYATSRESFMQILLDSDIYHLDWIYTGNPFLLAHSLHEALIAAEKNGVHPIKEKIMLNLAHTYEENDNPQQAIHWYERCLTDPYFSDAIQRADLLASLIFNFIQCEEFSRIDEYFKKLSVIEKIEDPVQRESLMAVKSFLQAKVGYYLKNLNESEIRRLLRLSAQLHQQNSALCLDMETEEMLGDLSYSNGNNTDAIEHYHSALKLSQKYQNRKKESVIYRKLSEAYEKVGKEQLAFDYYNKCYQLSEELYRERSRQYSAYLLEIYNVTDAEKDIMQLKKKSETLTGRRNTDFLTGLYNRRYWEETLNRMLRDSENSPLVVSILMIDVDNFKKYNDQYGHIQGDDILRKVGCILNASVKQKSDIAARYGGEEFIILLYDTEMQGSRKVAADILNRVRELSKQYHGGNIEALSLSIGISTGLLRTHSDLKGLLREADKALYYSKEHGRNTFTHVYDITASGGNCS